MKQATLCLLIRGSQGKRKLCLGLKKKRFGKGKWNAAGGRFDPLKDKNITDTAIRETEEEIGVKIKEFEKVAVFDFFFPKERRWNQRVHIFLCTNWEGEPRESEEMAPKWFREKEIPFNQMWVDDRFWLPRVLGGEKLKGEFLFETREIISEQNIEAVESFD